MGGLCKLLYMKTAIDMVLTKCSQTFVELKTKFLNFRVVWNCHTYPEQREWDGWAHKPGLTYLSLVYSPGPSVVLCVHCQYLWYFTKLTH